MKFQKTPRFLFILFLFIFQINYSQSNNYTIGVGISDITGQIAESAFFGYGDPFFKNGGIRDRQYARAYIVKDIHQNSVVYVSIDKGATFQSVNLAVIEKLREAYGNLYTDTNVVISATHTHVSPGGYSHYGLYNTSTGGFYKTNFTILVDGIFNAIQQAHNNLAPGRIYYNTGSLTNASINRSLVAYNLNADADDYISIDDQMTVLKFIQGDTEVGMISWFAVHPTNLSNSYKYASGDNKGHASLKFERHKGASYGKGAATFVAAFSNSNAGDMSPNLNQPLPSDLYTNATGPGNNEEESTEIIGNRQYYKALDLYNNAHIQLIGTIKAVSRYSDYSNILVSPKFTDGYYQSTCKAALGISFRAGAEDGRSGIGKEGQTRSNPTAGFEVDRCHMEKPIDPLFYVGANNNDPKTPKILPTSILKIGQLGILAAPAEFTVMAGRRVKATVLENKNTEIQYTVFAGYSDAYSGYVTTREEYASQQYEGASTQFGPWTLAAYRQEFEKLTSILADPNVTPWDTPAPIPPRKNYIGSDKTVPILFDDIPWFKSFGSIFSNTNDNYSTDEIAEVTFWGAHPNNDPKTNSTYFRVQKKIGDSWVSKYEDRDTNTKLIWNRDGVANSKITIQFKITSDVESGHYRIIHHGKWKNGWNGKLTPYTGISNTFYIHQNFNRAVPTSKNTINNILIYPNPTSGAFTIINERLLTGNYSITNAMGQIVKKGKLSSKSHHLINMDVLPGMYFIKTIFQNGETNTISIVKK
ncbi:ceramidase precursor containing a C-terminal secretion signal [Tenacibaculum maritimum]|uniref:neutral/alkaline non-lysosomal ceramidase N-terminal domain-containing protein n=1 Tax=Tenacibaculum maritimum TaxID=107401 RepID=UPI0012E470E6|nr:neutral/alkaline non-lysosomal ceramidase N-terminal domain-containing protein [Tenacibaculum maritimum]CAA0166718.1 ceramidase precursor containing a C-terminal secretion signal [Tenacibaculum maritimum]